MSDSKLRTLDLVQTINAFSNCSDSISLNMLSKHISVFPVPVSAIHSLLNFDFWKL